MSAADVPVDNMDPGCNVTMVPGLFVHRPFRKFHTESKSSVEPQFYGTLTAVGS